MKILETEARQHRPVMVSKKKRRGHMNIPPPGMVRNLVPHLDQAINQSKHGPFHFSPVDE
jgi:hypothetical protein